MWYRELSTLTNCWLIVDLNLKLLAQFRASNDEKYYSFVKSKHVINKFFDLLSIYRNLFYGFQWHLFGLQLA